MAVLDGLLSGVMGGMMGAMLVVMIPESNVEATVKIMAVLCSGIIFLLLLMLQGEVQTEHLKRGSFLMSMPAPMFSAIVLFLTLVLQTDSFAIHRPDQVPPSSLLTPNSGSTHNHGNLSGQEDSLEEADKELVVKAEEFSFSPNKIQIAVNEKVKVTLVNSGRIEHDFEVVGTGIHIHAQPGKKSTAIVQFKKSGTYKVICTLPGHKEAGMFATVQASF
jgi:plastocyanin